MRNPKSIALLLIGLFGAPFLSHAQTITREEFLNQLKERHPLFEKERLTSRIEKEERNSFLGAQDWNVLSSVDLVHEEPALPVLAPEETDAVAVSAGVERLFWKTGGRLSTSLTSSRASLEVDPSLGFPGSFYEHRFEITYTHPLMRNRNGFLDRLLYDLKQFDIDSSDVLAIENMEDFLAGSEAKYLDWVFLTEYKKIVSERLGLSEEELARTRRKREANLVDQADVIRAEDAVRIWKQSQVLVESQWDGLQAELAVLTQNDELYKVGPDFNLYDVVEQVALKDAMSRLKEKSRLISLLDIRLRQLEHVRRGFEDTSKPDLALVARFNTKNADEDFGDSLETDKIDALVGLQFSVPLGNRTAKAQIRKTGLQIAQIRKQRDEVTLTLTSALANLHIQIRKLEEVLKLNREQIKSAKERTKEELKLYDQGRGELTFVIQSRDNEQNAKLTYAQNALTYHKLLIEYRALMDELYQ